MNTVHTCAHVVCMCVQMVGVCLSSVHALWYVRVVDICVYMGHACVHTWCVCVVYTCVCIRHPCTRGTGMCMWCALGMHAHVVGACVFVVYTCVHRACVCARVCRQAPCCWPGVRLRRSCRPGSARAQRALGRRSASAACARRRGRVQREQRQLRAGLREHGGQLRVRVPARLASALEPQGLRG